ncbi:alanine racemase [Pseudidiomarina gelatinasegens]|uniref:alanine racemase n=1 Tax=Pseudidiomarina gelatinasegens TaxID=2487740 RepID=UPI0030EC7E9A
MANGVHFRPTRAEINRDALGHNAKIARQLAGKSHLLGVIKADGYGHGVLTVAEAISAHVDAFAVAFIDEAITIRNAGFQHPIVLLEGCFSAAELPVCAHYNFQPVVHQQQQLDAILTARMVRPLSVWLKVDTGMHRLGWPQAQVKSVYNELKASAQVGSVTMMSHFANAENQTHPLNNHQLALFEEICAQTESKLDTSLATSAALVSSAIDMTQHSGHWIRTGILIYGDNPVGNSKPLPEPLIAAMRLVAPVIALREVKAGESVGYGGTWTAERPSLIATVAIGYADGYPRHAHNGTPVIINGQEAPLAGTVSMDMITVDVTDLNAIAIGDDVELWGPNLSVARVAKHADTISYDLLTSITARVPRVTT